MAGMFLKGTRARVRILLAKAKTDGWRGLAFCAIGRAAPGAKDRYQDLTGIAAYAAIGLHSAESDARVALVALLSGLPLRTLRPLGTRWPLSPGHTLNPLGPSRPSRPLWGPDRLSGLDPDRMSAIPTASSGSFFILSFLPNAVLLLHCAEINGGWQR